MKKPDWDNPEIAQMPWVDVGERRYYNPEEMKANPSIWWLARTANRLFGVRLTYYERIMTHSQLEDDQEPIIPRLDDVTRDFASLPDPLEDLSQHEGQPTSLSLEQEIALTSIEIGSRVMRGEPIDDLLQHSNRLGAELHDLRDMFDQD